MTTETENLENFKNQNLYMMVLFIVYAIVLATVTVILVGLPDLFIAAVLCVIFWCLLTLFFFAILWEMRRRFSEIADPIVDNAMIVIDEEQKSKGPGSVEGTGFSANKGVKV